MQTINTSYRSLSFLFDLNWDRLLFGATLIGSLWLGSVVAGL